MIVTESRPSIPLPIETTTLFTALLGPNSVINLVPYTPQHPTGAKVHTVKDLAHQVAVLEPNAQRSIFTDPFNLILQDSRQQMTTGNHRPATAAEKDWVVGPGGDSFNGHGYDITVIGRPLHYSSDITAINIAPMVTRSDTDATIISTPLHDTTTSTRIRPSEPNLGSIDPTLIGASCPSLEDVQARQRYLATMTDLTMTAMGLVDIPLTPETQRIGQKTYAQWLQWVVWQQRSSGDHSPNRYPAHNNNILVQRELAAGTRLLPELTGAIDVEALEHGVLSPIQVLHEVHRLQSHILAAKTTDLATTSRNMARVAAKTIHHRTGSDTLSPDKTTPPIYQAALRMVPIATELFERNHPLP